MMGGTVLAIWSLANAAMLAFGAAAAIPLLIHLWSRRRHREHSWAAMQFLLAAMKKHSRRLRMEQFLLLAVRMLLLVLLAVALADPLWSWSSAAGQLPRRGAAHFFFVVDASFSMAFRDRDQTRLQAAQDRMRTLIEQSEEGDGFSLLRMEETPRTVVTDVVFDRSEMARQVDRLQISHTGADLPATLTMVEQVLRQVRDTYPRLARQRVFVFSDLGQNTWSDVTIPATRESIERLASDAELFLYDVGSDEQANVAVTSLTSPRSVATPGERLRLTAEVQSFGASQPIGARVEFLVDGRVVHGEDVQLAGDSRQTVSCEQLFEATGDQVVSVRVSPDSLPLDNERWLVVSVRKSLSVLCVGGEPEAAEFVALALNPDTRDDAPIQTTVVGETALLEQDLSEFDCVFLCNVGRVNSLEAAALHRYVVQGGGLVISLGDQVQADNYNRELAGAAALLPAKLGEVDRGEQFFDPLDYRHPLVAPFRGRERAGLLTVPIWRSFRLDAPKSATVALGLTSGHPAIVESKVGRGQSVLVATALSPSSIDRSSSPVTPWTALAAWPSFPPLVHGLLQIAIRGREENRTVLVGSPMEVSLRAADREIEVVRPDQQRQRLEVDSSSGVKRATFSDASRCGVYQFKIEGEPPHDQSYVANLDSQESNLRRISATSLPSEFRKVNESDHAFDMIFPVGDQMQLYRSVLVVVGILLLVEQLLAVSFARRSV